MLKQVVLSQRTWSTTMQYNPAQCRNEASLCKSRLQVLDQTFPIYCTLYTQILYVTKDDSAFVHVTLPSVVGVMA